MSFRRKAFAIAAATLIVSFASVATYVGAQPQEKVIKISAKRFDYTPGHLTLKKGEPVILELTTDDVLMGFNAPDLGLRADILPDKVTRVRVVPDKTGTFTFLCDVFCGTKHEEMHGTITVVD